MAKAAYWTITDAEARYLGFDSDYIIIGLAALVLILIILMIINVVQMSKLKKETRKKQN